MTTKRIVGNDTIKVNQRLLADLPHGDVGKLTYPNEMASVKTGKNGNVIYAFNASGQQATLELRVLRGSDDDKYLNQLHAMWISDPPKFVLMNAEIVKRIGDGAGTVQNETYILTGGVFNKGIEATSNTEGDVEQAVSIYTIMFAVAPRAIA